MYLNFLLLVFFMFRDVPGCSGMFPKVGWGLGDGDAGTRVRGRRTRGSDIGDVNKTYRCTVVRKNSSLFLHEHSFQFTVNPRHA